MRSAVQPQSGMTNAMRTALAKIDAIEVSCGPSPIFQADRWRRWCVERDRLQAEGHSLSDATRVASANDWERERRSIDAALAGRRHDCGAA